MKCLSVKQPWASLIASGKKTIELRMRRNQKPWGYRGPLIICASGSPRKGTDFPIGPLGVAICLVEVVETRVATPEDSVAACGNVDPGEHAWIVRKIRDLPPVPVKGQLSPWDASPELLLALGIE